jgi:hypothetical protein
VLERSVGLDSSALNVLFLVARPLVDPVLIALDRWYRGGRIEAPSPGSLWRAVGTGESSGGLLRRDLRGVMGLGRLPLAPLRGADPEADVMGVRAVRAAEPSGLDAAGVEADTAVR